MSAKDGSAREINESRNKREGENGKCNLHKEIRVIERREYKSQELGDVG